jgi:RNA polymerase sigma-70 factor (ECF subfamily)
MGTISDQEILRALGREPGRGTRLLFDKYYAAMVAYAGRVLRDSDRGEDVVQEFFIRLWDDAAAGRTNIRSLPAYLHAGVRHGCLACLAEKGAIGGTAGRGRGEEGDGRDGGRFPVVEVPAEALAGMDDDRVERVMREIERLPSRTRAVVEAVMLEGQKYREVAERFSISVNTVKFLLKEGTRRLRERVAAGARELLFIFFRRVFGRDAGRG